MNHLKNLFRKLIDKLSTFLYRKIEVTEQDFPSFLQSIVKFPG
jgi:hypothetical protein